MSTEKSENTVSSRAEVCLDATKPTSQFHQCLGSSHYSYSVCSTPQEDGRSCTVYKQFIPIIITLQTPLYNVY